MDHEAITLVFALFDCFGAILYELLIDGLMDPGYQAGAYESFAVVLVNLGKGHFRGTEDERQNFEWKKTKLGTGNIKNTNNFREQRNKQIYFRETRKQVPHPLRGFRTSLRRHNTTKVMAYNITRNSPLLYKQ